MILLGIAFLLLLVTVVCVCRIVWALIFASIGIVGILMLGVFAFLFTQGFL